MSSLNTENNKKEDSKYVWWFWFFWDLLIKLQMPWMSNKVVFFRLMAISQKAWLWMRETIILLIKSEKHSWMRRILEDILSQVNQWLSFYTAMRQHNYFFSMEEIELIKSSETMWNMPETLQNIATELENLQKIKSKMKNAMIYPMVVLFIACIAVYILLVHVMPSIVKMFPNKETLPWITKFMLWMSEFLQTQWYLIPTLIIWTVVWYVFLYRNVKQFKSFIDSMILKLPVISIVSRYFNLYRFSKLLWDFYEAWVSPVAALIQISEILDNVHYKNKMLDIKKDIEMWLWFTESMEWSYLFDPLLVQIIWVWENVWNIWEVLQKMAWFYREELDNKIEWLTKLLEPLMMAFVAIIVWTIVASVFLPMGDLIWTIGEW